MPNLKMYYSNNKPPGPIIMIEQSKTGMTIEITFITLFSVRCTALLRLCQPSANMQEKNCFHELNQHILTLLQANFTVRGHRLSTSDDALKGEILINTMNQLIKFIIVKDSKIFIPIFISSYCSCTTTKRLWIDYFYWTI